ncbi:MAG: hypothetical protein D8M22_02705 [Armatimonadetes bacterium]|nr:hypothetical protein [Armatimonadota bacterium]
MGMGLNSMHRPVDQGNTIPGKPGSPLRSEIVIKNADKPLLPLLGSRVLTGSQPRNRVLYAAGSDRPAARPLIKKK